MKTLFALIRKEILHILHDNFMLRLLIISPLMQLLLIGYALTFETKNVNLMICDLDRSKFSAEFIAKLRNTDRFHIIGYASGPEELEEAVHKWRAKIGLYIPPDFSENLHRKHQGRMMAILDAVDGNQAMTAYGYLQKIASFYSIDILPDYLRTAVNKHSLLKLNTSFRFNPELKNEAFMVPGIVVVILTVITLILASLGMVKEKETGTLEQLMVTPVTKTQLILGKQIPFLGYAFIELIVTMKLADWVFGLQMQGSLAILYLVSFFFLFTTLGLGLFVSTISRSQQQALFLAWFAMVFMILLSGMFIPIENMPEFLQKITLLNPMRYMMTAIREIYLKATPLKYLLDQVIPLFVLGSAIFMISVIKFSKKVS